MAKSRPSKLPQAPVAAGAPAGTPEGAIVLPQPSNALDVPSVYSNVIEILSMNWIDVRIAFNEVVIETGNQVRVERRANVVMPVAAFMTMVQLLAANAQNLAASQQQQAEQAQALLQAKIQAHGLKAK